MSLHRPAPTPPATPPPAPARRGVWPYYVLSGVLVCLLAAGAVLFFVVQRGDTAAPDRAESGLTLADGVVAGGTMTGDAQALFDALEGRGLECSVRFTSPNGGHAGCFGYASAGRTTLLVAYQYQRGGAVTSLTIKVTGAGETAPALQSLTRTVGQVAFPADQAKLSGVLSGSWGGAVEGSWGKYEIVARGPKTVVDAAKFDSAQLDVPVLHLDTTEPELAKALAADGYTCTADNETCQRTPSLALKFSGPDSGITYLVATGASAQSFDQLRTSVFGHLHGDAVAPVQAWISQHLDGHSHSAYVAGWRVDLEVTPGQQIRLTLFNDQTWLVMS